MSDSSDTDSGSSTSDENIDFFFAGSSGEEEVENPDNDPLASDDEEADAVPEAVNEQQQVERSGNIDW